MDMQPVSTCQETPVTRLTSIHIQDPRLLAIGSTAASNPESSKNSSCCHGFVHCFVSLFTLLFKLLKFILGLSYLFFKQISYVSILVVFGIFTFFFIFGPLSFLFFLILLLVVRFFQFIKRGEDYDKVTQVKMVVEWLMVVNGVLFALTSWLYYLFADYIGLYSGDKILGKTLSNWGIIISRNTLVVLVIRIILFWIIQKTMPRMILEHNDSGIKVIQATSDIVDCFFFLYLGSAVLDYLPNHKIFEFATRNWVILTTVIFVGWNIIILSTHFIVWSIHRFVSRYLDHVLDDTERFYRYLLLERLLSVQWLVYYGNGMKRSVNFILSSVFLFLVWVIHFENNMRKTVWDFGTRTCTILLILSFLWLLKDYVLLSWEANTVYNRLSCKILGATKSLYFLGMLGRHSHDILKLRYEVVKEGNQSDGDESTKSRAHVLLAKHLARVSTYDQGKSDLDDNDETEEIRGGSSSQLKPKLSNKKKEKVKHDLLLLKNDTITLFSIQQVAQYFLEASNSLSKETYTSDILRILNTHDDNREIAEKLNIQKSNVGDLVRKLSNSLQDDWNYFEDLLDLKSSNDVSYIQVKTWIEKSHSKCLFLARTIRSAREIVDCLDNIISAILICAAFILWLIFTGLADTTVLVLIASPLLAATFIFGDTCKNLFQGIIYIYVVHPFDVGDLCVIDEKMVEVISIGVWKTTFSKIEKVDTREAIIYPNSELATKTLINHTTEFDWNDIVEYDVEQMNEDQIKELQKQVEGFLDAGNGESMPSSHSVAVLSTGKDIRIVVRFKHNKRNVDMTYFECVKEKDRLRSAFVLSVQKLAKKVKGDDI